MSLRVETASWRLSSIEEEIEGLNINDDGPQRIKNQPRDPVLNRGQDNFPPPPDLPLPPYPSTGSLGSIGEEDIYSKACLEEQQKAEMYAAKEASRFITEKYDSLGRLNNKPPSPLPPPPPESGLTASVPNYATFPGAKKYQREESNNSSYNSDELPTMPEPQTPISSGELGSLPAPPSPVTLNYNPYGGVESPPLSDQEIVQVEMFYRSHKTDVFVSQCIVYLYVGSTSSSLPQPNSMVGAGALPESIGGESWTYMKNGLLVVVMDTGESRRLRKLSIVLAERGTGFVLWKESLDNLSDYQAPQPCFQTMHFSNDHSKLAGFRFQDAAAAVLFHQRISGLLSDPQDSALRLSSGKKVKEKKAKKGKQKLPNKADISSPCCFTHVTKLDRTDGMCMLSTPLAMSAPRQAAMSPAQSAKQKHRV